MSKKVTELDYKQLLVTVKQEVQSAQPKATLTVNSSLNQLHCDMRKMIPDNQALFEVRNNYEEQLVKDLREAFSEMKGFCLSNLVYVRKFYQFYADASVQQLVGLKERSIEISIVGQPPVERLETTVQRAVGLNVILGIPWVHHTGLLNKVKLLEEAIFKRHRPSEHDWSRIELILQIKQTFFSSEGMAAYNLNRILPEGQALMASQILKDPNNFGILKLESKVQERDIEKQLTEHITNFLLECGKHLALIGRQCPLQVGEIDYRLDIVFYHLRLRCFVEIDLEVFECRPEYAGKINFNLAVTDDQVKTASQHAFVGIIFCKKKDKLEVEYALPSMSQPISMSKFTVTPSLPEELKGALPPVEEFEEELQKRY